MSDSKFEPLELEQMHANIGKLMAETAKLNAEAGKLQRERSLYPAVIFASLLGALGAAIGAALTVWLKLHV